MVRQLWVLPFGCQRGRSSLSTMTERAPSASRFIASAMPTGPPPTMMMLAGLRQARARRASAAWWAGCRNEHLERLLQINVAEILEVRPALGERRRTTRDSTHLGMV